MGVFDGLVRIYESVRIYEFDIKMISPLPNLFKHVFVQYMFVNLFKQLISVSICAYLSKQVYQLQKCRKCNCINPYFSIVFHVYGGTFTFQNRSANAQDAPSVPFTYRLKNPNKIVLK